MRFVAAAVVFCCHIDKPQAIQSAIQGFRFEHDAVIAFFVLSGYVIAYACHTREQNWRAFAVARLSRVLSVSVPAVALAVTVETILHLKWPGGLSYGLSYVFFRWVPASLGFLNQVWFLDVSVASAAPYWSLAYEVWYYAAFAFLVFGRGSWRMLGPLAIAVFAGPKILLLAPLWLSGVALYHLHRNLPAQMLGRPASLLLFCGSFLAYAGLKAFLGHDGHWDMLARGGAMFGHPFHMDMRFSVLFVWDYLVAVPVLINFFAAYYLLKAESSGVIWHRWIRVAAGHTFSLYLYQGPVIFAIGALLQSYLPRPYYLIGLYTTTPVVIWVLGTYTEGKKHVVKRWVAQAFTLSPDRVPQERPAAELPKGSTAFLTPSE